MIMLGIVDGGNVVGESVYLSQKQQEFNKRSIRSIKNMFGQSESSVFPRSTAQQSMYAKQILRIAVAQTAIALSQAMGSSEPNIQPLEKLVDSHVSTGAFGYPSALILCFAVFATLVIAVCSICFMMPEPEPENSDDDESESESARRARCMACSIEETSDPEFWQSLHRHDYSSESDESPVGQNERPILDERIPLRPSMLKCYALLSTSFTRLKQLMIRDPRQRGHGFCSFVSIATGLHVF